MISIMIMSLRLNVKSVRFRWEFTVRMRVVSDGHNNVPEGRSRVSEGHHYTSEGKVKGMVKLG